MVRLVRLIVLYFFFNVIILVQTNDSSLNYGFRAINSDWLKKKKKNTTRMATDRFRMLLLLWFATSKDDLIVMVVRPWSKSNPVVFNGITIRTIYDWSIHQDENACVILPKPLATPEREYGFTWTEKKNVIGGKFIDLTL